MLVTLGTCFFERRWVVISPLQTRRWTDEGGHLSQRRHATAHHRWIRTSL